MKRGRNLSSTLSIYLLGSEILLAVIIIIVGYWSTKKVVIESLFHKLRYHTEEAISPIQNSMQETEWLIDSFTSELDSGNSIINPENFIPFVFSIKPGVVALRFVSFNPKDTNRIVKDDFFYREKETLNDSINVFYRDFPLVGNWMNSPYHRQYPEWSSAFYSDTKKAGFKQILIYSRPIYSNSDSHKTKGIIYCAISLDKELKTLNDLDVLKSGFPILISHQKEIIYPQERSNKIFKDKELMQFLNNLNTGEIIQGNKEGSEIVYPLSLNKKKSIALYWPVNKINWVMIAVMPVTEYMAGLNKLLLISGLLILLIGSLSAAVAIYFSRKLVSPITTLADASRKIIEDEGVKNTQNGTEVDVLSQSIELMKRKLRNYEKERLKTEMDNEEMEKELKLAREIEMGIVPTKFPLFPGRTDFDCYGKLLPAKIVGGDLFDFFLLDEIQLFLSICDTLGKGIPAAMFAVATRTLIRSIANPITRLGKMMELLNDELSLGHESDMYVTVLIGKLDLTNGEFAYCNAGHPRPFILRNNKQVEEFDSTHGFPIGVRKKQKYVETVVTLNPGETIIAYTDGITEEVDKMGNFFW